MATTCGHAGHSWQITAAPGWFRCVREVGFTKKKGIAIYCNAVAVCPACLGYCLAGTLNIFCALHVQMSRFEDFPVVQPSSDGASVEQSSFEQTSLW